MRRRARRAGRGGKSTWAAAHFRAERLVVGAGRGRRPRDAYAASVHAGTVADHIGRFRELAEAGVAEVMVRLPHPDCMEPMAQVIGAFRAG